MRLAVHSCPLSGQTLATCVPLPGWRSLVARRVRRSIRAHAQLLGFRQHITTMIECRVPDDLTGVTLKTATALGVELSPEGLCQYVLTTTGPITLYAYLNASANALMAAELNYLHFGGRHRQSGPHGVPGYASPLPSPTVVDRRARIALLGPIGSNAAPRDLTEHGDPGEPREPTAGSTSCRVTVGRCMSLGPYHYLVLAVHLLAPLANCRGCLSEEREILSPPRLTWSSCVWWLDLRCPSRSLQVGSFPLQFRGLQALLSACDPGRARQQAPLSLPARTGRPLGAPRPDALTTPRESCTAPIG